MDSLPKVFQVLTSTRPDILLKQNLSKPGHPEQIDPTRQSKGSRYKAGSHFNPQNSKSHAKVTVSALALNSQHYGKL